MSDECRMTTHRSSRRLRIIVLGPHFEPDTAPTGRVLTRLVHELADRGHELHVVAALPWYRQHVVEPGWTGRLVRRERVPWGSIRRVHPFPGDDRRNLLRRAFGFGGFSLLAGWSGLVAGGWFRRHDAVIAMSPPLTMGITGRLVAWSHRASLVFNVQDIFPDAAVETGAISNRRIIAAASWLERLSYRSADAVTVLSNDLAANVVGKLAGRAEPPRSHHSQLRRHRSAAARRSTDELPPRARHRRRTCAPLRRQRRILTVTRAARRDRPPPARRHGPDQRRRLGSPRAGTCCSRTRQRALRRLRAGGPPRRGARNRRHPRRAAASWLGSRQRAVEDLLDPRCRATRRGSHRRGHRGAEDARRVRRRDQRPTGRSGPLRGGRRAARRRARPGDRDGPAGASVGRDSGVAGRRRRGLRTVGGGAPRLPRNGD